MEQVEWDHSRVPPPPFNQKEEYERRDPDRPRGSSDGPVAGVNAGKCEPAQRNGAGELSARIEVTPKRIAPLRHDPKREPDRCRA
jgi:hypothetical protein